MTKPKVQIAYIHTENVSHSFHHSMMRLSNSAPDPTLYEYLNISALSSPLSIVDARNALMQHFLDQTTATHIWWIDTDMGFLPNVVEKLLAHEKDVIGALTYRMDYLQADGYGGYVTNPQPVVFDMAIHPNNEDYRDINDQPIAFFTPKSDFDLESQVPLQVAGTGTGCLLISRLAAEKVRGQYGDTWFDQVRYNTKRKLWLSEDLSFCYRLATVGIPIFVDPQVKTNHQKIAWI
jgi:GT2 family glycosyltransferase